MNMQSTKEQLSEQSVHFSTLKLDSAPIRTQDEKETYLSILQVISNSDKRFLQGLWLLLFVSAQQYS